MSWDSELIVAIDDNYLIYVSHKIASFLPSSISNHSYDKESILVPGPVLS